MSEIAKITSVSNQKYNILIKEKEDILVKCKSLKINLYGFIRFIMVEFMNGNQIIYDLIEEYKESKNQIRKSTKYIEIDLKRKARQEIPKIYVKKEIETLKDIESAELTYDFSETLSKQEVDNLYDYLESLQDVSYEIEEEEE